MKLASAEGGVTGTGVNWRMLDNQVSCSISSNNVSEEVLRSRHLRRAAGTEGGLLGDCHRIAKKEAGAERNRRWFPPGYARWGARFVVGRPSGHFSIVWTTTDTLELAALSEDWGLKSTLPVGAGHPAE